MLIAHFHTNRNTETVRQWWMTHFVSFEVKIRKLPNWAQNDRMWNRRPHTQNDLFHETIIKYHPIHYYQHKNRMVTGCARKASIYDLLLLLFFSFCKFWFVSHKYGRRTTYTFKIWDSDGTTVGYDFTFVLFKFQFSQMKSEKKKRKNVDRYSN